MREIGFTSKVFTPHSIVGQLSGGERQGVAIARAIYNQAELIVLDEPTTALSLTETAKVFHFVRQVRASGRSILFIGHNIHHVFDIADRFVVLDRGRVALEKSRSELATAEELIDFMEDVAQPGGAHAGRDVVGSCSNDRNRPNNAGSAAQAPASRACTPPSGRCGASCWRNRRQLGIARRLPGHDGDLPVRQSAASSSPGTSTRPC